LKLLQKVLTSQGRKYWESSKLYVCALHLATFQNHSKVDKLTKMVVQTIKQGLHKFGLQKDLHLGDWDFQLP
jgi:hypothetical protein